MRVILAAGSTATGLIDGLSAAGAAADVMKYTPAADAEILVYGRPTAAPVTPVSPTGCPTPAAITRAVREVVGFDVTVLEAGLAESTAAPTVSVGVEPGADIRAATAVSDATAIYDRAVTFGSSLPDDELLIGETIPGGTTTALGVMTALGEPLSVSSSLPENPLERKRTVVSSGLESSDLEPGACAGEPVAAIEDVGDPVQAAVAGVAAGALEADIDVTLGGGTQLVAAAAILRHAGIDDPLSLATTAFVADDPAVDLAEAADRFNLEVTVTDPGFDRADHVAMTRYCAGEAKEGVAMGGALSLVPDGSFATVRGRIETVCERLGIEDESETTHQDERPISEEVGDES
ncbi:nicotinate-nucleotide--dimethylbenzimidazole phosphoribosyltransferase [Natrialbaceae archaeon A-CW1-1]